MINKLIALGGIVTFLIVGLSGCTQQSNAELIIGRWATKSGWAQFDENNTYTRHNVTSGEEVFGTYEVTGNDLWIDVTIEGVTYTTLVTIKFVDDDTIQISDSDGNTTTQTRINASV
jgi:hypothetical protein